MIGKRPALAAAIVIGVADPAAAASRSFCDGALVAHSFYRITVNTESPGRAEYRGQFRFEGPSAAGQVMTATLAGPARVGNFRVIRPAAPFELGGDALKDVAILSLPMQGSRAGAPNAQTVGGLIDFVCAYRPAG